MLYSKTKYDFFVGNNGDYDESAENEEDEDEVDEDEGLGEGEVSCGKVDVLRAHSMGCTEEEDWKR